MLCRLGNRQRAARATTAGAIRLVVVPGCGCGVDILFWLIALINLLTPNRAIGTVTRRGITLTIATAAIGIALLITVLVTAIGAVTVTVAIFTLPVSLAVTIAGIPPILTVAPVAALVAVVALVPVAAIIAPVALIGIDPVIGNALDIDVEILVIAVLKLVVRATARLIFLKARPRFGKHAEIMIGELQIIFSVDPVALHLGVARQRLVFLEQLGRIAARPIIDAIAAFGTAPGIATTLRALPATTATAAGLTIVDQVLLSSCLKFKTGVAP